MSAGVGLVVMAAIFVFGVVLFGLLAITLLPGAVFALDRLEALRARRSQGSDPEHPHSGV